MMGLRGGLAWLGLILADLCEWARGIVAWVRIVKVRLADRVRGYEMLWYLPRRADLE